MIGRSRKFGQIGWTGRKFSAYLRILARISGFRKKREPRGGNLKDKNRHLPLPSSRSRRRGWKCGLRVRAPHQKTTVRPPLLGFARLCSPFCGAGEGKAKGLL